MTYYSKKDYKLCGYQKSNTKNKMYDALLMNKQTGKIIKVPFGSMMENYHDKTGLNLYPHLIHGDKERRRLYRLRAKHNLKTGFYSPSWFSYYILW
jgi:hypothetical protein